jgi:hypothetical protein
VASDRSVTMNTRSDVSRVKAQLLTWWIVWSSILAGLCLTYIFVGRAKPLPPVVPAELMVNLVGFVPLFVSVVLRWLVLPRYTDSARAMVVFVVGLALAESCGLLGIFLGGPFRDALFVLGVLGVVQYAPFYARKLLSPKETRLYS